MLPTHSPVEVADSKPSQRSHGRRPHGVTLEKKDDLFVGQHILRQLAMLRSHAVGWVDNLEGWVDNLERCEMQRKDCSRVHYRQLVNNRAKIASDKHALAYSLLLQPYVRTSAPLQHYFTTTSTRLQSYFSRTSALLK